jgi:hypothetical protein
MSWRSKLAMLVLTPEEQRTIAFVVLALVLGLATKHYRHVHAKARMPNEQSTIAATASPSPSLAAQKSRSAP